MSKVRHKQCKIALILGWRKYGCTPLCCSSSFFLSGNEFNFESRYLKKKTLKIELGKQTCDTLLTMLVSTTTNSGY